MGVGVSRGLSVAREVGGGTRRGVCVAVGVAMIVGGIVFSGVGVWVGSKVGV